MGGCTSREHNSVPLIYNGCAATVIIFTVTQIECQQAIIGTQSVVKPALHAKLDFTVSKLSRDSAPVAHTAVARQQHRALLADITVSIQRKGNLTVLTAVIVMQGNTLTQSALLRQIEFAEPVLRALQGPTHGPIHACFTSRQIQIVFRAVLG
jgi:hypothetical protein